MKTVFVNGQYMTEEEYRQYQWNDRHVWYDMSDMKDTLDDLMQKVSQTIDKAEYDPGIVNDLEQVLKYLKEAMIVLEERV